LLYALFLFVSHIIIKTGWGVAAQITPSVLLATGGVFFSLMLAPAAWAPLAAGLSTTPLMLAVLVGSLQNIMTKSSKYVHEH